MIGFAIVLARWAAGHGGCRNSSSSNLIWTMTKIILVRHGHVEGIDPPRFRGQTDVELSELGMRQARETARHIRACWSPVAVYTSPLRRCVATGQAISEATGIGNEP